MSYVGAIFDATLKGGTANVIGPIDTSHEFIFIPDLAETLIALSEKEEAYGKALECRRTRTHHNAAIR